MNKNIQNIISTAVILVVLMFSGIGLHETVTGYLNPPTFVSVVNTPEPLQPAPEIKKVDCKTESAEFITGPLAANVGELCVFKLNDPETRADWIIVPSTTYYIDSSGSSLAFASNVPAKYTIIAAIVEDGQAKILTHVCDYGVSPEPIPNPSPMPSPSPTPKPSPNPVTLSNWVSQNIPATGYSQAAALASCYESAAEAIDKGTVKTTAAAYSTLRTATQTKINIDVWQPFLDELSAKITERLDGSSDIKKLGTVFSEIATGLKAIHSAEPEVSADEIVEPLH